MDIKIQVKNKIASPIGTPVIVCDNTDYVMHFEFDAPWEAQVLKTARFQFLRAGKRLCMDVPFSGTSVEVPQFRDISWIRVGVYAGELHATTAAYIPCVASIRSGESAPDEPPQEVYDQIVQLINDGAVKGPQGEQGPPGEKGEPGKVNPEELETVVIDTLISMAIAPVIQDADGAVLTDADGAILLNM